MTQRVMGHLAEIKCFLNKENIFSHSTYSTVIKLWNLLVIIVVMTADLSGFKMALDRSLQGWD